jgi:hypothetical protein
MTVSKPDDLSYLLVKEGFRFQGKHTLQKGGIEWQQLEFDRCGTTSHAAKPHTEDFQI